MSSLYKCSRIITINFEQYHLQIWEVDSDWLKGGDAIHNGLFGLIISNYIDHVVYIQAVHGLVKHPQSYKIYFLEDNYLFTIYVQFIWLANVVFFKKANNRTCPSYNIRK